MRVKYLGTAAYEGVPSLFCNCRVCRKSMELGGRNLRSRSQMLVNDDLLIDFPADTVWHGQRYGLDWTKIGDFLITHSHSDHLYPEDVEMAGKWFSHPHRTLHFYSAQDGYDKLDAVIKKPEMEGAATVTRIEAGERFQVGEDGKYSVLALEANHDPSASAVIYSITCEGKRMLYAHDTGVFFDSVWEGLAGEGRYDLVSLDCTGCLGNIGEYRNGHMSLKTNLEVLKRMREEGLVDEKTIVVANHFSHNGGETYEEMLPEAKKHGIIVAYDGLEIEF